MSETNITATDELPAEHRTMYDSHYAGGGVHAIYAFPNGRRASVLASREEDRYQFWDFDTQKVPTADGLTLGEVRTRLAETQGAS